MDEYDKIYRKKLRISAVAHLAAVALALGLNFMQGCFSGKKPESAFDEIEFTVPVPAGVTGIPEPEPASIPEPAPAPVPVPVPDPPPKREIQISREIKSVTAAPVTTTTRPPVAAAPVPRPGFDSKLTEAEVRKLLAMGATPGETLRVPASETRRCMLVIENALFSAWRRPAAEHDTGSGAEITIRIGVSGAILDSKITRSSGNKTFDQSVVNAVNDTARFTSLTPDFIKQFEKGVIILFNLER